jgi:hypothetical protein
MKRNRTKHTLAFEDRLAKQATQLREKARLLPAGTERDLLLRKARQADTASHINRWLLSSGLRSPA